MIASFLFTQWRRDAKSRQRSFAFLCAVLATSRLCVMFLFLDSGSSGLDECQTSAQCRRAKALCKPNRTISSHSMRRARLPLLAVRRVRSIVKPAQPIANFEMPNHAGGLILYLAGHLRFSRDALGEHDRDFTNAKALAPGFVV